MPRSGEDRADRVRRICNKRAKSAHLERDYSARISEVKVDYALWEHICDTDLMEYIVYILNQPIPDERDRTVLLPFILKATPNITPNGLEMKVNRLQPACIDIGGSDPEDH